MPCTPCSTATTAVIDMYVCMHAFEYVHTPWPFSIFSLRIGGISFEEFSTGLRKLTHASDTSPIRVTPGDFDTLISISSEKGYPVPWLSALQIKKRFLCWVMKRGSYEMLLLAALFLHVFCSQSGIISSLYILQLKFRGLKAKHTRCWRAPYAKRFRNHRATTSCLIHSGVSSSELYPEFWGSEMSMLMILSQLTYWCSVSYWPHRHTHTQRQLAYGGMWEEQAGFSSTQVASMQIFEMIHARLQKTWQTFRKFCCKLTW